MFKNCSLRSTFGRSDVSQFYARQWRGVCNWMSLGAFGDSVLGDCKRRKMPCLRNCPVWVAGQVGADGRCEDNCVSSDRFDSWALKPIVFIAACVSSSDRKHWLDLKLCVACGRKYPHAVVRTIWLACSRSFVCLFWPQTRTPTRSRWLLWLLCLLQIFPHQNILFLTKLFVTISNQSSWGYNLCVICGHKCFPAVEWKFVWPAFDRSCVSSMSSKLSGVSGWTGWSRRTVRR